MASKSEQDELAALLGTDPGAVEESAVAESPGSAADEVASAAAPEPVAAEAYPAGAESKAPKQDRFAGFRGPDGKLLPGHKGGPGRKRRVTLEEAFKRQLGSEGIEEFAAVLVGQLKSKLLEVLIGESASPIATSEEADWLLKREWPVPQKIEASVSDLREDEPDLPTDLSYEQAVAEILNGDDTSEGHTVQ